MRPPSSARLHSASEPEPLTAATLTAAALGAVLEAFARPAMILDASGRLVCANQAAQALLRAQGRVLLDALHRFDGSEKAGFERTLLGDQDEATGSLIVARDTRPDLDARLSEARRLWRLTGRQLEVLALLAQGASNRTIASSLGLSVKTVELRVSQLLAQSRTDCRAALVAKLWAGQAG